MKKILSLILVLTSLAFAQVKKSVLIQEQKDSIKTLINLQQGTVNINDYVGAYDTSLGWSFVIQAAVDANLGSGKNILFEGGKTYSLQIQKSNPYSNGTTCIDLKTGGIGLYLPLGCVLRFKDNIQTDATGANFMIVSDNASNIYLGGYGTIDANCQNQPQWTGGYGQVTKGSAFTVFGSNGGFDAGENIIIEGLTVQNTFSNPIDIYSVTNVLIENVKAYHFGEGIQANYCYNLVIKDCIITNDDTTSVGDGYEASLCNYFKIIGNSVTSPTITVGQGIDLYGSTNGIVENNYIKIYGSIDVSSADQGLGVDYITDNILIKNNYVDSTFFGIQQSHSSNGYGFRKIRIEDNEFHNCGQTGGVGIQVIGGEGSQPNKPVVYIKNNILDNSTIWLTDNLTAYVDGNLIKNTSVMLAGLVATPTVDNIDSMFIYITDNVFLNNKWAIYLHKSAFSGFVPKGIIRSNSFQGDTAVYYEGATTEYDSLYMINNGGEDIPPNIRDKFGYSYIQRYKVEETSNVDTAIDIYTEKIMVDATGGNKYIHLITYYVINGVPYDIPDGKEFTVTKIDSSVNKVIVYSTPYLINGRAQDTLSTVYQSQTYFKYGNNYYKK